MAKQALCVKNLLKTDSRFVCGKDRNLSHYLLKIFSSTTAVTFHSYSGTWCFIKSGDIFCHYYLNESNVEISLHVFKYILIT